MSFLSINNQAYPPIYKTEYTFGQTTFSRGQLFNDQVQNFIDNLLSKQPFALSSKKSSDFTGYNSTHIRFGGNNIGNTYVYTSSNNRRGQDKALILLVGMIFSGLATFLTAKFISKKKDIEFETKEIDSIKKDISDPSIQNHQHVKALKDLTSARLSYLEKEKAYLRQKMDIVIATAVSGIFMSFGALASAELLVLAGATGLCITSLAGIFVWTSAHYDRNFERYAKIVKQNLAYLTNEKQPIASFQLFDSYNQPFMHGYASQSSTPLSSQNQGYSYWTNSQASTGLI